MLYLLWNYDKEPSNKFTVIENEFKEYEEDGLNLKFGLNLKNTLIVCINFYLE
ncbi:hypothetical protein [Campylobacter portucalensis]|uniref:hypothetical protein n=1 Tax=Campylobacter portucalensis TaxID=2608384 RepID=UPI0012B3DA9C|nr:hypothetical protein [Campylobacter portucalensis]